MRIHTDILAGWQRLYHCLPSGVYLELSTHGSRKRAHAFEVKLTADDGYDRHGIKRCYGTNSGSYGGGYDRAATWVEWGDWIVALFKHDLAAIIGPYDGADDFLAQTARAAEHRPARENAPEHAARWRRELSCSRCGSTALAHYADGSSSEVCGSCAVARYRAACGH